MGLNSHTPPQGIVNQFPGDSQATGSEPATTTFFLAVSKCLKCYEFCMQKETTLEKLAVACHAFPNASALIPYMAIVTIFIYLLDF